MADSSSMVVRYIAESTWGTTPAAALTAVPVTSFNPGHRKETFRSNRISSDAQVKHLVQGARHGEPQFGFELSYADLDAFLPLLFRNDWAADTPSTGSDRLENGTDVKSMTLEAEFTDIAKFVALKGARASGATISIQTGSMINGTFSFMSKGAIPADATVGTGGPSAAADNQPFNVVDHITVLEEGGSSIGTVFGIELTFTTNARIKSVLGTADPYGIGLGDFEVSGTVSMHYEDNVHYLKYINHTASSLRFQLTDTAGNVMDWTTPEVYYSDGNPDASGPNIDTPLALNFQAVKDPSLAVTSRIDRTAA